MQMQFSLAPEPSLCPLNGEGPCVSFPVAMRRCSSLKPGKVRGNPQLEGTYSLSWWGRHGGRSLRQLVTSQLQPRSRELGCLQAACLLLFLQSGTPAPPHRRVDTHS